MQQKDLTRGSVFRSMTLFALPMLLGNVLQQLYNVVDTWVVGRFISADALAGVGSSYTLMVFLTSILIGLCLGSGVYFSLCFGKRDEAGLREGIAASFCLVCVVTLALTAFSVWNVGRIMLWLNIPAGVLALTGDYLSLIFWGIPAVFLYNFFAAYLRAVGDSITPLVFLGVSTVINIALDLLFVIVFQWGTSGAAGATVLAQYVSGIGISIFTLARNSVVRRSLSALRVKWTSVQKISGYCLFTCHQQSVMHLGILMIQGLANSFGTAVMAAFAAAVKIDTLAYMPAQEYANAFATFFAQNRGAGEKKRMMQGLRCAAVTSLSYCAAISALMWVFAERLLRIFIDASETDIIAEGVRYLHIEGAAYVGIGALFLFYALYRDLGKPGMSLVLTVCSLGTRVALGYALAPLPAFGVVAIWWAIPIGWAFADLVGLTYLLKNRTRLMSHNV